MPNKVTVKPCSGCAKPGPSISSGERTCHECSAARRLSTHFICTRCRELKPRTEFTMPRARPAAYVCKPCRSAYERARNAAIRDAKYRHVFIAGYCAHCGAAFVAKWYPDRKQPAPRHCCDDCRIAEQNRRPRLSPVQRQAVFERDKWICQICRRRVSKKIAWPHPMSAVIDHIVPLSAGPESGGVHALYNVQCAHQGCNSRKQHHYAQGALL